jgi:hypothetical protein
MKSWILTIDLIVIFFTIKLFPTLFIGYIFFYCYGQSISVTQLYIYTSQQVVRFREITHP